MAQVDDLRPEDFDAVLFDLNGTFMFGHDRLGEDEDFYATYRALGGNTRDPETVQQAVNAAVGDLTRKYSDDSWHHRFPSVPGTLRDLPDMQDTPDAEIALISDVIACHELGDVDSHHTGALGHIASSHPIGVVSNIWSGKQRWLDRFDERGILNLFGVVVFSSDGPHMKPSPILFQQALKALGTAPGRTLFVGDDPVYDVAGAGAVGMRTVLVGGADAKGIEPDWRVGDVIELARWF